VANTLAPLTRASFEPLLRQRFALRAGDHTLELELIEVKSLGAAPRPHMREPFSLLFDGPREPALRQGSYSLEHAAVGARPFFLVPIGRDQDHTCYQAIFT
jgi:hypothetical protein